MSESGKTVFERIRAREIPGEFVYEDEEVMVIKDIRPAAPVHVLVIPKKAYPTLEDLPVEAELPGKLVAVARRVARELGIAKNYKLLMNVGRQVQAVPHIHLHLLGGWEKPSPQTRAEPG